jgi:hypothetical protein
MDVGPSGQYLAVPSKKGVVVAFDLVDGEKPKVLDVEAAGPAVAVALASNMLVAAHQKAKIVLWGGGVDIGDGWGEAEGL